MKGHDIAEQVRVGSLPREANGGEIGTCNFSAEAGVRRTPGDLILLLRSFARLRGGLAAKARLLHNSGKQREIAIMGSCGTRRRTESRRVGQKSFATGTRVRSITSAHWGPQHLFNVVGTGRQHD